MEYGGVDWEEWEMKNKGRWSRWGEWELNNKDRWSRKVEWELKNKDRWRIWENGSSRIRIGGLDGENGS